MYRLQVFDAQGKRLSDTEHELPQDAGRWLSRIDKSEFDQEESGSVFLRRLLTYVDHTGDERAGTPSELAAYLEAESRAYAEQVMRIPFPKD